ncbi:MAG: type II toxin-antitoxin system RelE/ParE family toxin [Stellaceae bacterium]
MQVIWSPAALHEIEHIYPYLAQFNPRAAENMVMEILAAGGNLENFPYRGRAVRGTQLRETTLAYPYIIRCRIVADHIVRILRVRHGARRPTQP